MRSWQRAVRVGLALLTAGALATVTRHYAPHGFAQDALALAGAIGLGVGGSVLASALVARVVATQVFGVDIGEAVEALRGSNPLSRANQTLDLTLTFINGEVLANAEHRFELLHPYRRSSVIPFHIYTDCSGWGSDGGFYSIVEPDENVLRNGALAACVRDVSGKARFDKKYKFHPDTPALFKIDTFGHFRPRDRLIWTVEHISSDFEVRVRNYTGLPGFVGVKVNHHREGAIVEHMTRRRVQRGELIEFAFLGAVLPFQGFELQWTFEMSAGDSGTCDQARATGAGALVEPEPGPPGV